MIVYRKWETIQKEGITSRTVVLWDGWFLFGLIPIYIRWRGERKG